MSDEEIRPESSRPAPAMRRFIVYAVALLLAFLLGLIPMWLKYRESSGNLVKAEQQLSLVRMQNDLASAVIDARRGDYEPARKTASQFFTTLSTEIDRGDASVFTQAQRAGLQPLFAGRDELITLLARSDPASADRLSDLYASYRKVMNS